MAEDDPKKWWLSGTWVATLTTLVGSFVSLITVFHEWSVRDRELALAQAKQAHEVQSFYFKAAVSDESSEPMRKRVLRYLRNDTKQESDESLTQLERWARGELNILVDIRKIEEDIAAATGRFRRKTVEKRVARFAGRQETGKIDGELDQSRAQIIELRQKLEEEILKSGIDYGKYRVSSEKPGEDLLDAMAGRWTGEGFQGDHTRWKIVLDLFYGEVGDTIGLVIYPTLNCRGKWKRDVGYRGYVVAREEIVDGAQNCMDNGFVQLKLQADGSLAWAYYHPSGDMRLDARSTLRRPGLALPQDPAP